MTEEKVVIESRRENGGTLVGLLTRKSPVVTSIALICHGQLGHKNYLFQPLVAKSIPYSSFRFDFRGSGESSGSIKYGKFQEDMEDLDDVIEYFRTQNIKVIGIIGHSRGGMVGLSYAAKEKNLQFLIVISTRSNMELLPKKHSKEQLDQLKEQGYFYWEFTQRGKLQQIKVSKEEIDELVNFDTTIASRVPFWTPVLNCHGLTDDVVPVEDVTNFTNSIPNSSLELFSGANHLFQGKNQELVDVICNWLQQVEMKGKNSRFFQYTTTQRYFQFENIKNFRDFGGYPTKNGMVVKSRMLFRSGEIVDVTDLDNELLCNLGVNKAFDLRSDIEFNVRESSNVTFPTNQTLVVSRTPIFKMEDYSPIALATRWGCYAEGPKGFANAYMTILEKGGPVFKQIFEYLSTSCSPTIVFCTAGKDRTGVLVMLLLSILGVSEDIICIDYSLTEKFEGVNIDTIQRIIDMTDSKITKEGAMNMLCAKKEAMEETFKQVQEKYGGIDSYIKSIGISQETIEGLKNRLLIPPKFLSPL